MNREELENKTPEELQLIEQRLDIKPHHREKTETRINNILAKLQPSPIPEMVHPSQKHVEPSNINTKEKILGAIEKYIGVPGFEAIFHDDDTWTFKCKGAEDSGPNSVALRVIQMKAESVSKGRRALRAMADGKYTGYAGNILV